MRGWSQSNAEDAFQKWICPAYAGVILVKVHAIVFCCHLSRVCGGDPGVINAINGMIKFLPRMRGWSPGKYSVHEWKLICPAYAGMIPEV